MGITGVITGPGTFESRHSLRGDVGTSSASSFPISLCTADIKARSLGRMITPDELASSPPPATEACQYPAPCSVVVDIHTLHPMQHGFTPRGTWCKSTTNGLGGWQ